MRILNRILSSLTVAGALLVMAGCQGAADQPLADPPTGEANDDHDDHPHADEHGHGAGPHDGTLADWGGGKYHVEFTVDHSKQEATVYILGSDEKTATPIKAEELTLSIQDPEMQVTLKAAPQATDPDGSASRFVGNHKCLVIVQEYAGTITAVVDGTPYSGDFKEEPHGADGQSHGSPAKESAIH